MPRHSRAASSSTVVAGSTVQHSQAISRQGMGSGRHVTSPGGSVTMSRHTDLPGGGMQSETRKSRPNGDTDVSRHTVDANGNRLYVRRQSETTEHPSGSSRSATAERSTAGGSALGGDIAGLMAGIIQDVSQTMRSPSTGSTTQLEDRVRTALGGAGASGLQTSQNGGASRALVPFRESQRSHAGASTASASRRQESGSADGSRAAASSSGVRSTEGGVGTAENTAVARHSQRRGRRKVFVMAVWSEGNER